MWEELGDAEWKLGSCCLLSDEAGETTNAARRVRRSWRVRRSSRRRRTEEDLLVILLIRVRVRVILKKIIYSKRPVHSLSVNHNIVHNTPHMR